MPKSDGILNFPGLASVSSEEEPEAAEFVVTPGKENTDEDEGAEEEHEQNQPNQFPAISIRKIETYVNEATRQEIIVAKSLDEGKTDLLQGVVPIGNEDGQIVGRIPFMFPPGMPIVQAFMVYDKYAEEAFERARKAQEDRDRIVTPNQAARGRAPEIILP